MHDMTLRNSRMATRVEMIFRRHPIRSDMSNVYRNVQPKLKIAYICVMIYILYLCEQ